MGIEGSRLHDPLGRKLPKIQSQHPCKIEFEIPKRYESPERRESNNSNKIGNLNVEIYRCPSGLDLIDDSAIPDPPPLGSLSFQTHYEDLEGQLKVHLIGARRLPKRHSVTQVGVTSHGAVCPCDTLVSLCLLPDHKFLLESYVQYGTQEPEFDEVFVFKISHAELILKTLRFTVYDASRHHVLSPIGHVLCSLKTHDCGLVVERNIKPHSQPYGHSRGLIHVRLQYIPASEKVIVGGIEAHKLVYFSLSRREYFVKITQITNGQKIKTRKTPTNDRDKSPVFKHSLVFSIPRESLGDTSLVVTLFDHGLVRGNKVVGRAILGPHLFKCDNKRSHWGKMVKFAPQGIDEWHGLYL